MRWSPPRDKHEVRGTQPGCLLYFLGELGGKYEVRIHRRKSAGCRTWKVSSGAPGGLCKAEETHSLTRTREQTVGATGGCVTTESSAWLVVGCQGHRNKAGSSRSWAGAAVRARRSSQAVRPQNQTMWVLPWTSCATVSKLLWLSVLRLLNRIKITTAQVSYCNIK